MTREAPERFPTTRRSAVVALRSDDPAVRARSIEALARVYWKPIYKYVRVKWRKSADEAAEVTQDFFATALERDTFARYQPEKGRFRSWVKACVDNVVVSAARAQTAQKRSAALTVSLDFEVAERELGLGQDAAAAPFEDAFDVEWARHVVDMAVGALRQQCADQGKGEHFLVFERYDLEPGSERRPSYAELAAEASISVTDVGNRLQYARRELRRLVLETLRETTATDDEFRQEAMTLLGVRV